MQLPKWNLGGTGFNASVDKKLCSKSACDFLNLVGEKEKKKVLFFFWKEGGIDFKMLIPLLKPWLWTIQHQQQGESIL